jgi:DNA repair exonuclease SbcCD ATPase subunit
MTIFDKIRYKNFIGSGDQFTEINLNTGGTTLILGENGAGKSTVLDALAYCLFGKAYRNINIPQLVNSLNGGDMLVETEFHTGSHSYLVRRGLKPGIFEIYDNTELIPQDSRKKDYQTFFEQNILRLNYKSFCQVVVLGITTFTPFMALPAAERRFIIEDLLGIEIFSAMNKILKLKNDDWKDEASITDIKYSTTVEKIELVEGYIVAAKADADEAIRNRSYLIDQKLEEKLGEVATVERLTENIEELQSKASNFDSLQDKINALVNLEDKLNTKIKTFRESIEFFQTNDDCPTCKQPIDSEFKTETITTKKQKIEEMETALEELNTEIQSETNKLDNVKKILETIRQHQIDIQVLNNKVKYIDNTIKTVQAEIKDLKKKKTDRVDTASQRKQLDDELITLTKKKDELTELRHYYDLVALMLKDSGIKTKIIRQYLPIINKLVNKYLSDMGFFVNFHLDEAFKEVMKSRGRDEFTYNSFSEGEKLRIDMSLLFTWREIARMKNSANTNLLILDEIFDSSLDASGVDEFMKLIQIVGKGINIFIITHKGDTLADKFDNSIKFSKVKNFSVMDTD